MENICKECQIFVIGGTFLQGMANISKGWKIFASGGKYLQGMATHTFFEKRFGIEGLHMEKVKQLFTTDAETNTVSSSGQS